MKQIKTIYKPMDPKTPSNLEVQDFDNRVNAALAAGWVLVRRDYFHPVDTSQYYHPRTLYAELEREIITDDERSCDNCQHCLVSNLVDPCLSCDENCSKWEPIT